MTSACLELPWTDDEAEEVTEPVSEPAQGQAPPPGSPPPSSQAKVPPTPEEASRFLVQSSFGPTPEDIADVEARGFEGWIAAQAALPVRPYLARLEPMNDPRDNELKDLMWANFIEADDQLRHRVAYALANIVTISMNQFGDRPETFAAYMDVLQRQAFGNYEDLIREVTLSPAMGVWLSHLGNRKADPEKGIEPDENYAREVMQLFTIGLVELNPDGTPTERETYTTEDVQGLAAVFTGLSWADTDFERPRVSGWNQALPMEAYGQWHEREPKAFLRGTVDVGTDAIESTRAGLDVLLAHPNLAPFVSKQLIQHLVTSNPTPGYVARVGQAFETGRFAGPEGTSFGTGRRGDMTATIAAILLDQEARSEAATARPEHGRLREPALRFAHLARAFKDDGGAPSAGKAESVGALRYADDLDKLSQEPYAPPSVFGWYRPGYVVPGGWTAREGLVAPEMQLATGSALSGYLKFVGETVENRIWGTDFFDLDRDPLIAIAEDPIALLDRLDLLLTAGMMGEDTRARILEALELAKIDDRDTEKDKRYRVELALLMAATSPEFSVQR
jgi:uncharacterized protein (DUF1800 family)